MDFTIRLNEGLYNSGVLGFCRVLEHNKLPYSIVDAEGNEHIPVNEFDNSLYYCDSIKFSSSVFDDFADYYLKTVVDKLGNDASFNVLIEINNKLKGLDYGCKKSEEEELVKNLKQYKDTVQKQMNSNSYKAAYKIINNKGEEFDFLYALEKIKKLDFKKDYNVDIITEALDKMIEYKDVFLMKNIMYTNITDFWSGIAFLHRQKNTSDISEAYAETFVQPISDYVSNIESGKLKRSNLECCHCGAKMKSAHSKSMSWINGMGVDLKRKTSHYWKFNADLVLCPVCSVIYSCMPLGFTTKGSESYFINLNSSISALRTANNFDFSIYKDFNYYQIIRMFIEKENSETAKYEVDNVQVLRRSKDLLFQNILSKDKLYGIKKCSNELQRIIPRNYTFNKVWYNLFNETIDCIFNHSNMYRLINEQFLINIRDGMSILSTEVGETISNYITALENIQIKLFDKGDERMNKELMESGLKAGKHMRFSMIGPDKNEKKIRGLSFRLVNALKCRNINLFLDTLMRQYLSDEEYMPKELTTAMDSEESFLCYGYAFLNGLNSFIKKDSENKEEITNE